MANFKYDKTKFGEIEGLDELIEQAIGYGKKSSEVKVDEVEKTYKQQMEELKTELNAVKNETKLNEILSGVPSENKGIISKLINNDPTKIDDVKKEYSHLFQKKETVNLKDILNGNLPSADIMKSGEELKTIHEQGGTLSAEEEKAMWDYVASSTK